MSLKQFVEEGSGAPHPADVFGVLLTSRDFWPITVALNNIAGGQTVPFNLGDKVAAFAVDEFRPRHGGGRRGHVR